MGIYGRPFPNVYNPPFEHGTYGDILGYNMIEGIQLDILSYWYLMDEYCCNFPIHAESQRSSRQQSGTCLFLVSRTYKREQHVGNGSSKEFASKTYEYNGMFDYA